MLMHMKDLRSYAQQLAQKDIFIICTDVYTDNTYIINDTYAFFTLCE